MDKQQLWLVGQVSEAALDLKLNEFTRATRWEFQGVFDSEEKAVKACRNIYYFVAGPFYLNENLPHETEQPEKNYFPIED